jgi:hypothetical protein
VLCPVVQQFEVRPTLGCGKNRERSLARRDRRATGHTLYLRHRTRRHWIRLLKILDVPANRERAPFASASDSHRESLGVSSMTEAQENRQQQDEENERPKNIKRSQRIVEHDTDHRDEQADRAGASA